MSGFDTRNAAAEALAPGGPWISNPRQMQQWSNNALKLHNGGVAVDSDIFFSSYISPYSGAVASIPAADTFVTVCDITGSGLVTALIAPHVAANTGVATFEVTVDGEVHTFTMQSVYAGHVGLAVASKGESLTGYPDYNPGPWAFSSAYNSIYGNTGISAFQVIGYFFYALPYEAKCFGLPALRFNKNFKFRVKSSTYTGANPQDRAAAIYTLDV